MNETEQYRELYINLKNIANIIYKLYRRLAYLEYNNQLNSKEYSDTLSQIEKYKKIEDEYCIIAGNTANEEIILSICARITREMCGNRKLEKLINDPYYIINSKIKENDIVCMRVSSRIQDVYIHDIISKTKDVFYELVDAFVPQRDKYFLEILSDQINDKEFSNHRQMLIDAKYDYAFINCKESVECSLDNFPFADTVSNKNLLDIVEYAQKFSKLNNKTFLDMRNRRRFLLGINYIRANLIQMSDDDIENLKNMISLNRIFDKDINDEGVNVFLNILSFVEEDKEKYKQEGFSFKRKY